MNISHKIIFSLLISALIFTVFTAAAFTGLFDMVETRFYNPQIARGLNREAAEDARVIGDFLAELDNRFAAALAGESVKRSFLPDHAEEDMGERSRIFGILLNSLPGLRSVRFVDAGGSRIHFSTLAEDLIHQEGSSFTYRSYRDCPGVLPYQNVESPEGAAPRIVFDGPGERLIFSYPFSDTLDVYRGSALFTFSVRAVAERMIREGQLKVGEDLSVVSSPGGFLLGLPGMGKEDLKNQAAALWQEGILGFAGLDEDGHEDGREPLVLVSAKYDGVSPQFARPGDRNGGAVFTGRLVQESLFTLPPLMRSIFLGSFFLTLFLFVFLLFNLRQDAVALIRDRLKRLQKGLFRQYYEQKEAVDWKRWTKELAQRRGEVRAQIKRGLPRRGMGPPATGESGALDALIDLSWNETVAALSGYPTADINDERLRAAVLDILRQAGCLPPGMGTEDFQAPAPAGGRPEEGEELEELEVVEDSKDAEEPVKLIKLETEIREDPEAGKDLAGLKGEDLKDLNREDSEVADGKNPPGGIVAAPDTSAIKPEAMESNPPEKAAETQSAAHEDLSAVASRIEFGLPGESGAERKGGLGSEDASPFETLSFESPNFSRDEGEEAGIAPGEGLEPGEGQRKRRQAGEGGDDSGLTEITEDGGLPFIYRPFLFQGKSKPLSLRSIDDGTAEPIRERNGIHMINSDILDPDLESSNRLDPRILQLVESIIAPEKG
ncbi:MAG: hypothetical protein LBH51_09680 [Treponema sp.]|jgi:hypothetical protein|nr:hypothetical protein [Treponema sp.]